MKFPLHFHTRQRQHPYPAKSLSMRVLDVAVYVVGVVGPLATIPQLVQIYATHSASGVSFTTWGLYAITDIPWIIYALMHREPPLIMCYLLWFVFNSLVAFGVLLYGGSMPAIAL